MGAKRLSGQVEVDETYIGGLEEGVHGRQTDTKALVIIACEAIEPGSVIHTDRWEGYGGLKAMGYKHKVTVLSRRRQSPSDLLPRVHLVASLLKRWLLGTHQGAVSSEHLAYYLDEFTFRFNRRKSKSRGKLFYRLIQQAVAVEPAPYKAMVKCYAATNRRKPQPVGVSCIK